MVERLKSRPKPGDPVLNGYKPRGIKDGVGLNFEKSRRLPAIHGCSGGMKLKPTTFPLVLRPTAEGATPLLPAVL